MTPEQIAPLATCFWIGVFTAYFAKKKKKKAGKWFALGFFVFGPIIYVGIMILITVICDVYYHRNYFLALFTLTIAIIIFSVCLLLAYRRKPSKKKSVVDLKKCPKCQAFLDASKEECPNCGEKILTEPIEGPRGLRGWLILPAIVLLFYPIGQLIILTKDFLPIFQEGYWQLLTTPGSGAYHHLWAPFIVFEIAGRTIFLIFDLILIFLFFTKSYRFPKLFIILLISNLMFVVAVFFFTDLIAAAAEENDPSAIKVLVSAIIIPGILVPYFMVSKRVKNTFVRPDSNIVLQPTQ